MDHMDSPVWAISGPPGSGKTTLTAGLSELSHRPILDMHELVARVDPESLTEGRMADSAKINGIVQEAFDSIELHGPLIIDGWPRTPEQAALTPADAVIISMWAGRDEAIRRMLLRARADDTPEIAGRRYDEQSALMSGWLSALAGWNRCLNTTHRRPEAVLESVWAYLIGNKREVF